MLDTFKVPRLVNVVVNTLGIDSPEECLYFDKWKQYPHQIEYRFNERGYRDQPWPEHLQNTVWCIGDSFTMGVGSPKDHTWPVILSDKIKYQTIAVALNGGSNAWIARKIKELTAELRPKAIVAQWSYTHRREVELDDSVVENVNNKLWQDFYDVIKDSSWPNCDTLKDFVHLPELIQKEILTQHYSPHYINWFTDHGLIKYSDNLDEERMQHYTNNASACDDSADTIKHVNECVELCRSLSIPFVYGFIPNFSCSNIQKEKVLGSITGNCWGETPQLDRARDWLHYDKITAEYVTNQIVQRLGDAIA
jgi:hypothetical protein